MVAPLARAVRNEITALNCRLALVVDPRIYRVGRNEKKKTNTRASSGRPAIISRWHGPIETESLHVLIVWQSWWGCQYERAVRNGKNTRKHRQIVVGQVGSLGCLCCRSHGPLEAEARGLFCDGESLEMNGLLAVYAKNKDGGWGGFH